MIYKWIWGKCLEEGGKKRNAPTIIPLISFAWAISIQIWYFNFDVGYNEGKILILFRTPTGRGRVFLRLALNDGSLAEYIRSLMWTNISAYCFSFIISSIQNFFPPLLRYSHVSRKYYDADAIIRSEEQLSVSAFISSLSSPTSPPLPVALNSCRSFTFSWTAYLLYGSSWLWRRRTSTIRSTGPETSVCKILPPLLSSCPFTLSIQRMPFISVIVFF